MGYCGVLAGVRENVALAQRGEGEGRVLVLKNRGEHRYSQGIVVF